ncbi:MAG: flippase-like domain-containing protein [Alphaproteobacteria bacterium]|nr:flippase-like domain-containing protein [Alphaproteobacteria bacterium]
MTRKKALNIALGLILGLGLWVGLAFVVGVQKQDLQALWMRLSLFHCGVIFILTFFLALMGAHKWEIMAHMLHKTQPAQSKAFYRRHIIWQSWTGQFVSPTLVLIFGRGLAEKKHASFRAGAFSGVIDFAGEALFLAATLISGALALFGIIGWMEYIMLSLLSCILVFLASYVLVKRFRKNWLPLFPHFMFWSFMRVLLILTRLVWGVFALGVIISPLSVAAAAPLVAGLSLIPITPGNLGIIEWGWAGVLALGGQSPLEAALLAMGFRVLVLIAQTLLVAVYEVGNYTIKACQKDKAMPK